jgi:CRP-like cAMP-binding protein
MVKHSLLFKARGYANREIMNRLESFKAKAEDTIFCKGDPSTYFYVIVRGSV